MGVVSKQLCTLHALGTGGADGYTVPSGKRTIVKSIIVSNLATSDSELYVIVRTGSTDDFFMGVWLGASNGPAPTTYLLPWMVVEYGQHLYFQAKAGTMDVIVSGAELVL